ncbi:MAG: tRNA pseudouridine(55) synthase TruB [Balneolaceae bacterium]|nr:tRNA pseudouridine(55) synthase TruB [Balneolaceae bacterium]
MAIAIPLDELPVYSKENPPQPDIDFSAGAAFLLNKPKGWSSFDVVKFVRRRVKVKKVGHAGTLDPMATGLLIVCCGKATKSISQFQELYKEYIGEITLGGFTPSYDAETDITETGPTEHITRKLIQQKLEEHFSGEIHQVPPMYSALKRGGKKLYELARKGETVVRPPRAVIIYESEIMRFNLPKVTLRIKCSKGTYIRSIAHDLGETLGTKGFLSALERTYIGEYASEQALHPHKFGDSLLDNG